MLTFLKILLQAPLTGRISDILPFFPFSPGEQAVIAHKYLLQQKREMAKDIDITGKKLLRHITLKVVDDARVCRVLADDYERTTGARSIMKTVERRVNQVLTEEWFNHGTREVLDADNDGEFESYSIAVSELGENEVLRVYKN